MLDRAYHARHGRLHVARARTKRQFWSYAGLAVVTRSSRDYRRTPGGIVHRPRLQVRGLTRRFNRTLKTVFKGAAVTARRGALAGKLAILLTSADGN